MSSIALNNGSVGRERGDRRNLYNRLLIILICSLLVILAFQILFHLVVAPRVRIRSIRVQTETAIGITDEEIIRIAGLGIDDFYFSIQTDAIEKNLEAYPLIREAEVVKVFPDTVRILLSPRRGVAVSLVSTGRLLVPVTLDDEGVVFELGTGVSDFDLPVISGLQFTDLRLGMRLPGELTAYLEDLRHLKDGSPALFDLISEYKFVKKNRSGYEVLLYPEAYPVKVRTGAGIDGDLVRSIMMILDVVTREGLSERLEEIDMRTGEVVYRVKGEESAR